VRAIIYARVSTRDKGQDVDNQLPEMRAFVQGRGWNLKDEFVDYASAGGKVQRDQFESMIEACERGGADVLLVWALDRLSREGPLRTMLLIEKLSRCRVRVKSMKEPWLDPESPTYELLLPIFAWIAKQERVRIGERVRAGMERARGEGKTFGRPRIEVNRSQVARWRAQGLALRAIATRAGVSEGTIRRLLKSNPSLRQKGVQNDARKTRGFGGSRG